MKDDRGAVSVEFALTFVVLIALVGLVAPLPYALSQKGKLEQAAARTVRWATSVPAGVRPARVQLPTEAETAFRRAGGRPVAFAARLEGPLAAPHCPTGRRYRVVLSNDVDLAPFAAMLSAAGLRAGTLTLTARATSCEE